ncbi:hypothetical protein GQ53DRAFT_719356 [Thozetella sp. PMI_491]|nr:hypothetical protein GQ53DRAFT_719356 [Thozetella sp. PMI_491]
MEDLSELERIAKDITSAAKFITAHCDLNFVPHVSLAPDGPDSSVLRKAPVNVQKARQTLISAAMKIQQLATEPTEYLPSLAAQHQVQTSIRWLSHFQILAAIPLTGAVEYRYLASICDVPERQLQAFARMAMTSNFLCEPHPGRLAHTALSRHFVSKQLNAGAAKFVADFLVPVASKAIAATERWGTTDDTCKTAANVAMSTALPIAEYLAHSDEFGRLFAASLSAESYMSPTGVDHLVADYDWHHIEGGLVVHSGPGSAAACLALTEAFPALRCTVQVPSELEVGGAKATLSGAPDHIRTRIDIQIQDPFVQRSLPIRRSNSQASGSSSGSTLAGPTVFVLRTLLRCHADQDATRIVRAMKLALISAGYDSRLLITEAVLPTPVTFKSARDAASEVTPAEEMLLRARSLCSMHMYNTTERDLDQFRKVLQDASDEEGRFVIMGVRRSPGCLLSTIEIAYRNR